MRFAIRKLKAVLKILPAVAILILLSGCSNLGTVLRPISCAPVVPPRGYLFHHNRAPLIFPDVSKVEGATTNLPHKINIAGMKIKTPEQIIYIKIPYINVDFAMMRSDIEYAIHKAGIREIVYADYEYFYFLGYYKSFTIHAYGYQ